MKAALDTMLSAPEFDLVVAVVGSSARFQPELAVKPVIDSASSAKPLVTFLVPDAPQALRTARRRPACRISARLNPAPMRSRGLAAPSADRAGEAAA